MKKKTEITPKLLLRYAIRGAALAGAATVAVFAFTISGETLNHLKHFPLRYIPALFALTCCSWLCTGARIWLLARAIGCKLDLMQAISAVLSMEFGIAASPAGSGGAIVMLSVLRLTGVPLSAGASVLAADIAVDALFFTLFTPFALFEISRDPAWDEPLRQTTVMIKTVAPFLIGALLFLAAVLYWKRGWMRRVGVMIGHSALGGRLRLPARFRWLRAKLRRNVYEAKEITLFLLRRHKRVLALNFLLANCQWFCRYGMLPLILMAFGTSGSPLSLIFVQCFLFVASFLFVIPGGGGGVEVLMSLILQNFAPMSAIGVILALWRFFTYYLYLAAGGLCFFATLNRSGALAHGDGDGSANRILKP